MHKHTQLELNRTQLVLTHSEFHSGQPGLHETVSKTKAKKSGKGQKWTDRQD